MSAKPFDPTLKTLVEIGPADWAALAGEPPAPVAVIDADIGTVSGAGDKALRVEAQTPYLLHLEFAVGHDAVELPPSLQLRNTLLGYRHRMLVRTVAILLRPEADSPALSGMYERTFPDEAPYSTLRYRIVRTWELPPDKLLHGGLGTLALTPISDVTTAELPDIIDEMEVKLRRRRWRRWAGEVWAAANILMGLRYERELIQTLLRGVRAMKESVTYQAILEEGEARGVAKGVAQGVVAEGKRMLLLQGTKRFGAPDGRTRAAIDAITETADLEGLAVRLLDAESWRELIDIKGSRRRLGRDR